MELRKMLQEYIDILGEKIKYLLFTPKEQQALLEDIAILVEDGVPLHHAVSIVRQSSSGMAVDVATSVLAKMSEGKLLSDGFVGWYPESIVAIIRVGEEGGTLPQSMLAAAAAMGHRNSAVVSLINSLIYPLAVVVVGLIVSVFIKHSVFVSFAQIKPLEQWPNNGQVAMAFATFVQKWWWLVLCLLVGSIVFVARILRSYIGDGRSVIDNFPILSLYRKFIAARVMETLGLLISNGVVIKKALRILKQSANPYLASHLLTMEYRLSGGKENLADVLDTGLLDKQDVSRLRVIARGRSIDYALIRQGRKATQQNMDAVNKIGRVLGALLLTAGAGLTAFFVTSIYSVGSSLSGM